MQISLFDGSNPFKIDKPIRLIELFAGYGSQHFALEYLGVNFESWKICEWAVKSIQAYKDAHFKNDNTDYSKYLLFGQVVDWLTWKGISANYNDPMSKEQIKRLGEEKCRQIYNNIKATHNLVNICEVTGSSLEIKDTDKYCYVMTYSFPCQDLSLAGLGKGMEKGSGTRSGLLWEVERILDEIKDNNKELPQVLLMENVPEVIGQGNIKHFAKWIEKLEELGYKNKWQVLNATDFGLPQNRERCFMVSVLGDYYYDFPQTTKLDLRLRHLLEKDVDETYFLSEEKIKAISKWKAQQDPLKDIDKEKFIAPTLTARGAGEEHSGMILINENVYREDYNSLEPKVIAGIGEKKSNGGTQWYQQDRIYDDNIAISVTTSFNPYYKDNLRIRKLTPKECFRLMGVKDNDFENIAQNQSKQSLYHLAGDSIATTCLMAILSPMIGVSWLDKFNHEDWCKK